MSSEGSDREEIFDEIIADYLDAIEAGESPEEEALLDAHPEFADSLAKFFLDNRRMRGLFDDEPRVDPDSQATELQRIPGSKTTTPNEQSTYGLNSADNEGVAAGAERIGDYLLLDKIAQGGMGVVYQARQLSLNRIVALKMIRSGEFANQEEIRRFRAEAEAAAKLNHANIVPIFHIGSGDGQHFFSMAYIQGKSLAQMIKDAPLGPRAAATYVAKVSRATHYAHQQGIIHRDIKPANVLVDQNNEPLVTDFGLAKQIQADHELTMSGQILGTASYMSPEQAGGKNDEVSAQSDVYSLGALLYALLTQRPPFSGDNPIDILLDVLSKDPATPSSLNISLSRDLETICMKCLEKSQNKRYLTAEALAEDLERFIEGKPILARRIGRVERVVRWCKRKPAIAAAIALATILAVGSPVTYAIFASRDTKSTNLLSDATTSAPTVEKPSLIRMARAHYSERPVAGESIYSAAAIAMLQFKKRDPLSQSHFANAARLIKSALDEDPSNEELKSALADCYVQLGRLAIPQREISRRTDAQIQVAKISSEPLVEGLKLVKQLRETHADNAQLKSRHARALADLANFAPNDTEKKSLTRRAMQVSREFDHSNGLIRFTFLQQPPVTASIDELRDLVRVDQSNPMVRFNLAHALTSAGRESEAIRAYSVAFSLLEDSGGKLSGERLRQSFRDLAQLEITFGQTVATTVTESLWPHDVRGFYDAVLGIRLAE